MMKKYYLLAAGLLLMLGSCSQDDIVDVNHDGDEIQFTAITNSASRAGALYDSNNLPSAFNVSAISGGKNYISDDVYEKNENGVWAGKSTPRYWPEAEDATVDFYARVGGDGKYVWNVEEGAASAKFVDYEVEGNVASQEDLLYAVTTGAKKTKTPVALNFRHALSQIVFQAKNSSQKIYVEIYGVRIDNVQNKGTFAFPNVTTTTQVKNPGNVVTDYDGENAGQGTWSDKGGRTSYTVEFTDPIKLSSDGSNLDAVKPVTSDVPANAMVLLPQTTTAWDKAAAVTSSTGSCISVKCRVYNIAKGDGVYSETNDEQLIWGSEDAKGAWLAIPAAFDWAQGKKYIYTLIFGKGGGGYDPDDPNPDPEFVPITFNVTVDDFLTGGNTDVDVDLPSSSDATEGE